MRYTRSILSHVFMLAVCISCAGCGGGSSGYISVFPNPPSPTPSPALIGHFSSPTSVSAFPDGTLLVCDQGLVHSLYSLTGVETSTIGATGVGTAPFANPTSAIIDNLVLYVVDAGSKQVDVFQTNSVDAFEFTTSFGLPGTGAGEFTYPTSIAADSSNNIYVVDSSNDVVEAWTVAYSGGSTPPTYTYRMAIGQSIIRSPQAVATDANGNVYVADAMNDIVYEFSSAGDLKTTIDVPGTAPGHLSHPVSVAVDQTGNVYVADSVNTVVDEFVPQGSNFVYSRKIGASSASSYRYGIPTSVSTDGYEVFVLDSTNKRLIMYPPGY